MYKTAIKKNSEYLVPFLEGVKYYGSNEIEQSIGTMMILNNHGDVLTCKHIAQEFILNDELSKNYHKLLEELKNNDKEVEKKYNLSSDSVILTNINLPFEIKESLDIEIKFHKYLDLAVISFKGIDTTRDEYPVFSKKSPLQGQSLCKLGFAFPEYDLFEYSKKDENIVLKNEAILNFPLFPLDGIMTRNIADKNGNLSMYETSTPGIKGQSGGPVFSPEGVVYGIQSMTKHLDLNFDLDVNVKRGTSDKNIVYTPFMNLGVAVSSVEIIKFLKENNIEFKSK